jgi:competence protein ComEC
MHVGVLMLLVLGVATWMLGRQRYLYLLIPLVVIWGYAIVSGGSPSVLRAAAMGTVFLAALVLAAAIMTAASPGLLRQVSFQLSFVAVGGIAVAHSYFGPRLTGDEERDFSGWRYRLGRPILALTIISAAAALTT